MDTDLVPDIQRLIQSTDFAELRERLVGLPARRSRRGDPEAQGRRTSARLQGIAPAFAEDVFEYLDPAAQRVLVKTMGQEDVAALLNHMAPDDRTLLFGELPANVTKHLLSLLTPEERSEAMTLLGYEPGTIGRLMTPHYIAVREDWSVSRSWTSCGSTDRTARR